MAMTKTIAISSLGGLIVAFLFWVVMTKVVVRPSSQPTTVGRESEVTTIKADVDNLKRLISLCVTEKNLKKLHLPAGTSVEWLNNDEHGKPVPLTYYRIKQGEVESLRIRLNESDKRIAELKERIDSLANITYRQWSESHGSRSVAR